jgi:GTP-binding protein
MVKIALIGPPNVGKSSLFNRLACKKVAIVSDLAGTTRDIRRREIVIYDKPVLMLDTGGIDETNDAIFTHVKRKAIQTAKEADIVLFMVDGKKLPEDSDKALFYELQKLGKTLALVVNKIDNDSELEKLWEFFSFGIDQDDLFGISVSHNRGTKKLFDWIYEKLPENSDSIEKLAQDENETDHPLNIEEIEQKKPKFDPDHIKVAIIGKPNVGKSSILNALIGEERSVVSSVAGTTIDPVDETYQVDDKLVTFVDTAGLRRRGKITGIEKYALLRTEDMLLQANVALVVLDASEPLSDQDEKISGLVDKFGLGTIIVLNKWDEKKESYDKLAEEIRFRFRFLYYAPIIAISAKTGRNIEKLEKMILSVSNNYHKRISTSVLNKTIERAIRRHSLPSPAGNRLRIYFATQFDTNPPTIAVIMNKPKLLHFSYKRYLINFIRDNIDFEGVPLRVVARGRGQRTEDEEEFESQFQQLHIPTDFVLDQYQYLQGDDEEH